MEYMKLYECAIFSDKRTKDINKETYISTENMLPYKGGITITESLPNCLSASKYEPHDILLSNIRPYFQKIWYADRIGSCSNDVLVLKSNGKVDSKFLYYVLSDKTFFDYDTLTSKGTKMPRGTKNAIMKYIVPDVTLPIQRKIASILSAYDSLIENNTKRIHLLEQMAENLYKEWFVRFRFPGYENAEFVNGLPKEWTVEKIGTWCRVFTGKKDVNQTVDNGEYIFFSCSPDIFHSNDYIYDGKAIIVAGNGSYTGRTRFFSGKFDLYQRTYAIVPIDKLAESLILYLYARFKFGFEKIYFGGTRGSAIPYIVRKDITHYKFFYNKKIIEKYVAMISPIFDAIEKLQHQSALFTRQRDLLLPRLMSGKLEVKSIKE